MHQRLTEQGVCSCWCYAGSDCPAREGTNNDCSGSQHTTLTSPSTRLALPPSPATESLFRLTTLVRSVALLGKSDTMHICELCGCVGVCKMMYFHYNKDFCYRKRLKWSSELRERQWLLFKTAEAPPTHVSKEAENIGILVYRRRCQIRPGCKEDAQPSHDDDVRKMRADRHATFRVREADILVHLKMPCE